LSAPAAPELPKARPGTDQPPQSDWLSKYKTELIGLTVCLAVGAVGLVTALSMGSASLGTAPSQPASQFSFHTSPPPAPLSAYAQGLADRLKWQKWLYGLTGDMHAGAAFWASERSNPNPGSCYEGTGQTNNDFKIGCLTAKEMLRPTDARRKADPDYRQGWNSY
jgi:hypothetical protein